jgi:hypothetical protein
MPEVQTAFRVRDVVEKWAYASGVLASGRLHLDDVGAEIGHHLAAELALLVSQFQDQES